MADKEDAELYSGNDPDKAVSEDESIRPGTITIEELQEALERVNKRHGETLRQLGECAP